MSSDYSNRPDWWRQQWEVFQPHRDDSHSAEWQDAIAQLHADPTLQEWWAEVQRRDALIRQAFDQPVPVPGDLAERILHAVDRASHEGEPSRLSATNPVPTSRGRPARRRRRWWLASAVAVALSVCVVIVIGYFQARRAEVTEAALVTFVLESADRWTAGNQVPPGGWRQFASDQFPYLGWQMHRWAQIVTPWDRNTRVFEASTADGRRLYVFEFNARNSLNLPPFPYRELPSTGPWKAGAWFEAGKLYVAVSNDPQILSRLGQRYRPA